MIAESDVVELRRPDDVAFSMFSSITNFNEPT